MELKWYKRDLPSASHLVLPWTTCLNTLCTALHQALHSVLHGFYLWITWKPCLYLTLKSLQGRLDFHLNSSKTKSWMVWFRKTEDNEVSLKLWFSKQNHFLSLSRISQFSVFLSQKHGCSARFLEKRRGMYIPRVSSNIEQIRLIQRREKFWALIDCLLMEQMGSDQNYLTLDCIKEGNSLTCHWYVEIDWSMDHEFVVFSNNWLPVSFGWIDQSPSENWRMPTYSPFDQILYSKHVLRYKFF